MFTKPSIPNHLTPESWFEYHCGLVDASVREFASQFGPESVAAVSEAIKAAYKKGFLDDHEGKSQLEDNIASGKLHDNLRNGYYQSSVKDSIADMALNTELQHELPKLFEKAELQPIPVRVSRELPRGIPIMLTTDHMVVVHPDMVPLLTKEEKIVVLAHELGHEKTGLGSTREAEFAMDGLAIQWTGNKEALKSALQKMKQWDTDQVMAQIKHQVNRVYGGILPDKVMQIAEEHCAPHMERALNSSWVERIVHKVEKWRLGMEHPTHAERLVAIDTFTVGGSLKPVAETIEKTLQSSGENSYRHYIEMAAEKFRGIWR